MLEYLEFCTSFSCKVEAIDTSDEVHAVIEECVLICSGYIPIWSNMFCNRSPKQ